jgi:3-oxoacyl-[acyl-carrier-protein] synthase II
MSDVVITGIGVISSMGVGREAFWEGCRNATSGIKKITHFDVNPFRTNVAGWIDDFNPKDYMSPNVYRRMGRVSRLAVAASIEALEDSKLALETIDKDRIGVIMGTAYGSSSHVEDFFVSLLREGPRGAQPFLFPETVPNAPASHIAMFHGITGPNTTFCQNDISAENAILYAVNLLSQNIADVVLVGGADELTAMQYGCYDALGVLNKIKVKDDGPVKPAPGGGLVLGEGAGILIMEKSDSAYQRGAPIYGAFESGVSTGGIASIGRYEVAGKETARAISLAMEQAGIDKNKAEKCIDIIDVSANFSPELDRMEFNQLSNIFPNHIEELMVTPLKYLMGNFGGAGAIRVAAQLLSLRRQLSLPSINVYSLKGESDEGLSWNFPSDRNLQTALMTSSTFGGGSCSLVFSRIPADR